MPGKHFFKQKPIRASREGPGASGIQMPIDILLGLPDYAARPPAFNLVGALSLLLGRHADMAEQMLRPHVWAPSLDKETLAAFAASPVRGSHPPEIYRQGRLRATSFPGQAALTFRRKDYEIVHFYGQVLSQGELLLGANGEILTLEALQKGLQASRTRLFIYEAIDQENFKRSAALAALAKSLGLGVLRVFSPSDSAREEYLMDVYANLLHNRPLPEMAAPQTWLEEQLQVELTYPQGREDMLNFDRWMDALEKRLARAEKRVERIVREQSRLEDYSPRLHREQLTRLFGQNMREAIENSGSSLRENLEKLRMIRNMPWDHERDGAVYLPRMQESARMADRVTMEAFHELPAAPALAAEIRNAPRVLNANFAEPGGRVIPLPEPLKSGQSYQLLVDIGPRWNRIPNLLGDENAAFPEQAVGELISAEERQQGWFEVEAVFVSEQFTPNLVSARMRVPLLPVGRSIPYAGMELAAQPGPVQLTVQAPQAPENTPNFRAHGRLCLYYGAQVIQSAILEAGVQNEPSDGQAQPNSGVIDYVLTPGFRAVEERLATRSRGEGLEPAPVKVGLMLNDDLSGSHRLLLKMYTGESATESLPPAWKSYDADMLRSILERARTILANPGGRKIEDYDSETFLLDKFKEDLTALASLGAELYSILLQGITPGGGVSPLIWRKKFRAALQPGDVLQLARAGSVPTAHIVPWALVYELPIEPGHSQKPLKICRVVDEQWSSIDAARLKNFAQQATLACPYEHEHETNIICPFGFWGYQYSLEQPISALHNQGWDLEPARRVLADVPVRMAVAATEDVPRQSRFNAHFEAIRQAVSAEYIPASLARERDEFRDSLRAPQLVYILCHGGKSGKVTTLSIGPRDQDAKHTLTPDLPGNWGEHDYIDLEKWEETRPLVFINGCYTTDLLPELTLDFVSAFRDLMVGGVIGTEIEVTVEFGYQAAEKFFSHLGRGQGVGQAILSMRWDLLNQGSFLGLAYTPYAMSDLHLERAPAAAYSPPAPPVAPAEP